MTVSDGRNVGAVCENKKCAPASVDAPAGTTCSHQSHNRPEGALGIMLCQVTDRNPQPRVRVAEATATLPPPIDRHWFVVAVDDEDGTYCAACGLPRVNQRHAERAA